jgi:hypothetical protein
VGVMQIDISDIASAIDFSMMGKATAKFLANGSYSYREGNFSYALGTDREQFVLYSILPDNGIVNINLNFTHPTITFSDVNFYITLQYTKTTD